MDNEIHNVKFGCPVSIIMKDDEGKDIEMVLIGSFSYKISSMELYNSFNTVDGLVDKTLMLIATSNLPKIVLNYGTVSNIQNRIIDINKELVQALEVKKDQMGITQIVACCNINPKTEKQDLSIQSDVFMKAQTPIQQNVNSNQTTFVQPQTVQPQAVQTQAVQPQQNNVVYSTTNSNNTNVTKSNKKKTLTSLLLLCLFIVAILFISKFCNIFNSSDSSSVDTTVTTTINATQNTEPFLMYIEDKFNITGKGVVLTGYISRGSINIGDEIQLIGFGLTKKVTVKSIEKFNKSLETANAGDSVGIGIGNIDIKEIMIGQALITPDSMKSYKSFDANIEIVSNEETVINTLMENSNSTPFYIGTTEITGSIISMNILENKTAENMKVYLSDDIPMEVGTSFLIKINGIVIAKGTITKVY